MCRKQGWQAAATNLHLRIRMFNACTRVSSHLSIATRSRIIFRSLATEANPSAGTVTNTSHKFWFRQTSIAAGIVALYALLKRFETAEHTESASDNVIQVLPRSPALSPSSAESAAVVVSSSLQSRLFASAPNSRNASSVAVTNEVSDGFSNLGGNTPLMEIPSLSAATGCRILVKCEHLSAGGSIKDRPANYIVAEAEREGRLVPKWNRKDGDTVGTIVEATGGNTGVTMALLAAARGYKAVFTVPDAITAEKIEYMRQLGAEVKVCPLVAFDNPQHFYQVAQQIARDTPGAVWGNQFEGSANRFAHLKFTAPEIWHQAGGKVDGLCVAAGTGGTISGLTLFLKEKNPQLKAYLIDPPGSILANYIKKREKTPTPGGASVIEGIGIGRITANFAAVVDKIDGAFYGTDREAVEMAYYLLHREGLYIGPSAALNIVGAVKLARKLGPGKTVVSVICDGGDRYKTKLFNETWLKENNLQPMCKDYHRDHADFVL